jgi:hypothetical protein
MSIDPAAKLDASRSSPSRLARLAGALLLIMAASAMLAELGARAALVVPGDAAATAARILGAPLRFRLGFVGYLVAFLCDVPVAVLFYLLLRRGREATALIAMAFRLVYAAIAGASLIPVLGALSLLDGGPARAGIDARVLPALVYASLEGFAHGFRIALVFFGLHLVLLGALLGASRRLPRAIGAIVAIGGTSYLVDGASFFLAPALHARITPILAALATSELVLAIWLVVKGLGAEPAAHVEAGASGAEALR